MYVAAWCNNVFILKYMLDNQLGIDTVNLQGSDNKYTPLMLAIACHHVASVEILCNCETIDIDTIRNEFWDNHYTALECAAFFGHGEILKILLRTWLTKNHVKDLQSFQKCLTMKKLQGLIDVADKVIESSNDYDDQPQQCYIVLQFVVDNYNEFYETSIYLRYNLDNLVSRGKIKGLTVCTHFYDNANTPKKTVNEKSNGSVDRWKIHEHIGSGSFGKVMRAVDLNNGMQVALKFIKTSMNASNMIELILNEIDTILKIDHKNVIKLLAYNLNVENSNKVLLAFEYAPCGELYQFLAINKYFNQNIAKTFLEQILDALQACHSIGIIHRDIKPQNILLDYKYNIKIADFGLSTYDQDIKNKNKLHVGTRGYMSPEIASPNVDYDDDLNIVHTEITSSCDIFSLGVILWQMLNGVDSFPFDQATPNDPKYKYIVDDEPNMFWKCHYDCRIVRDDEINAQHLLLKMFTFDPTNRIAIDGLKDHNWYTKAFSYNGDQNAQSYFLRMMQTIHKQLLLQSKQEISRFQKSTLMPSILNKNLTYAQSMQSAFRFSHLTYAD